MEAQERAIHCGILKLGYSIPQRLLRRKIERGNYMKKLFVLLITLIMMMALCVPVYADTEEDLKNAEANMNEAEYHMSRGDYGEAGWSFALAGSCYAHCLHYSDAADAYLAAAEAFELDGLDDMASTMLDNYEDYKDKDLGTGTIISEGSLTIIVGIATAVIFGLGGFFVGRKTKAASNNSVS